MRPCWVRPTLSSATYTATTVSYTGALAFTDVDTDDLHSRSPDFAVGAAGGNLSTTLSEAAGAGVVSWAYQFIMPTVFGATVTTVTDSFIISMMMGKAAWFPKIFRSPSAQALRRQTPSMAPLGLIFAGRYGQ